MLKDFSIYSPAWYIEIRQADGQLIARRVDAIHGTVLANENARNNQYANTAYKPQITQQQRKVYNNNKKGINMQEQGLKVSLLASGSSGNATYIETPKQKILVDCGLTGKAITAQMEKIDRSISDVDAILVNP